LCECTQLWESRIHRTQERNNLVRVLCHKAVSAFLTVPTTSAESWPYLISASQNKNSAAIEQQTPRRIPASTIPFPSRPPFLVHPTTPAGPPIVSRADIWWQREQIDRRNESTSSLHSPFVFSAYAGSWGRAVYAHALAAFERLDWQRDQRVLTGITFRTRGLISKPRPELHSCRRSSFLYYRPSRQRCAESDSELEGSLHCAN
jgi:hypothetical protein